jgi:hypothetical protein
MSLLVFMYGFVVLVSCLCYGLSTWLSKSNLTTSTRLHYLNISYHIIVVVMIAFKVNDTLIECEETNTLLDLRKRIIEDLHLSCSYVDIQYVLEKPIRILGKFNVEPGPVPRTLDRYTLNRFAYKDILHVEFTEVTDYDPSKNRMKLMSGGRGRGQGINKTAYVPPSTRKESTFDHGATEMSMHVEPSFVLDSEDDFPSL